jgi:hypothetical protein
LQQLKWKEQEKEEDQYKTERWGWRGLKNNRNKKNKQAMARDSQKWRKTALEAKVHNRL